MTFSDTLAQNKLDLQRLDDLLAVSPLDNRQSTKTLSLAHAGSFFG